MCITWNQSRETILPSVLILDTLLYIIEVIFLTWHIFVRQEATTISEYRDSGGVFTELSVLCFDCFSVPTV